MMSILISVCAFIVAIGILVTVHEFGHFWVARRLGVKVLRFSVGFGRPLWRKTAGSDNTEYVVAAIPLGGYVKMLDEREGGVGAHEVDRAFNRQSVWTRIAVISAGPLFNFLFAIFAYWVMFIVGVSGMKPVIGSVAPDTIAATSGLRAGDQILAVNDQQTATWQLTGISLLNEALEAGVITLTVEGSDGATRSHDMDLSDTRELLAEGLLLDKLGLAPWRPNIEPVLGEPQPGSPADRGGLRPGDRVLGIDGQSMETFNDLVKYIQARPDRTLRLEVERTSGVTDIEVHTESVSQGDLTIGRIGAPPQVDSEWLESELSAMRTTVRYGPVQSLPKAVAKTWEISLLTVRVLWKLVTGKASVKNISGPITIAEYAGVSAVIGLSAFLGALAIFSISIGILNLLPVPILDGGHQLYCFIEVLKGSPVSETTEAVGQRIGLVMLAGLMGLAFYNDLARLIG